MGVAVKQTAGNCAYAKGVSFLRRLAVRVVVESLLPCNPAIAWAEVRHSRLLQEVCFPLVTFLPAPGETLPVKWPESTVMKIRSYLLGLMPLGTRDLAFVRIDPQAREIHTAESDALVARWDHVISIAEAEPGFCRYRDEIEVEAGWLTPLVWLFARCLYGHRQLRWRGVARRLAQAAAADLSAAQR